VREKLAKSNGINGLNVFEGVCTDPTMPHGFQIKVTEGKRQMPSFHHPKKTTPPVEI
jgi:hypothetical protein